MYYLKLYVRQLLVVLRSYSTWDWRHFEAQIAKVHNSSSNKLKHTSWLLESDTNILLNNLLTTNGKGGQSSFNHSLTSHFYKHNAHTKGLMMLKKWLTQKCESILVQVGNVTSSSFLYNSTLVMITWYYVFDFSPTKKQPSTTSLSWKILTLV